MLVKIVGSHLMSGEVGELLGVLEMTDGSKAGRVRLDLSNGRRITAYVPRKNLRAAVKQKEFNLDTLKAIH